jgi:hypothetical protein
VRNYSRFKSMSRRTAILATMTTNGLLRKLTILKVSSCFKGERMRNKGYEELKSIIVDVETDLYFASMTTEGLLKNSLPLRFRVVSKERECGTRGMRN